MDFYQILNINYNSSEEEIKKAYKLLALKYHPDKCKDQNAKEKFQEINYAYNILINSETRSEYNKINKKSDFHDLLEKIYNKENIDWNVELNNLGVKITKKKLFDIGNLINNFNLSDLMTMFTKNIIVKKEYEHNDCSESDMDSFDELVAEYYNNNNLPIMYQKYNKYNINLNLKIDINDIINNNIRKIKINRYNKLTNEYIKTTFKFNVKSNIVVFHGAGDISNENGHLIIHLDLPECFDWNEQYIYYNFNTNLYEYIYGFDLTLTFLKDKIEMKNYTPYRDGNYYNTKIKLGNSILIIKINLHYEHTEEKKHILYNNFK
jgi:curved DNA-binding protein CbpA